MGPFVLIRVEILVVRVPLLLGLEGGEERVEEPLVLHAVNDHLVAQLAQALVLDEVLQLLVVEAHAQHLVNELLFQLFEEFWRLLILAFGRFNRFLGVQLTLNAHLFGFMDALWHDVVFLHELQELSWNLLEGLLGQLPWVVLELAEWNELDDVALHIFLVLSRVQRLVVCVEHVH